MTAPVFLAAPALLAAASPGDLVLLDGAEGRHAVSVRRLVAGEPVELVDGGGRRVAGEVAAVSGRDRLTVRVRAVVVEAAPLPRIAVVQALPKGERGELAVELCTEVGVDVVVPWAAARCVAVWRGDRAARGAARWRTAAAAAAKQARRARVPEVADLASTAEVAARVGSAAAAWLLDESATAAVADLPVPVAGDLVLVVGPEGGVTADERAALVAAGATPVRLGPTVLRTSTAGVVAAAVALSRTDRWRG